MRLLFVCYSLGRGGAEHVLANLSNAFCDNGHEVSFITSVQKENEYVLDMRIKRYLADEDLERKGKKLSFLNRSLFIRKVCKKIRPDAVVVFLGYIKHVIFATRGLPLKVIVSLRNDPKSISYNQNMFSRLLYKALYSMADGCVFQTEEAKGWFPERVQKKSVVLNNTVEANFFDVQRSSCPRNIVAIGRLSEQKNHKMLINAFSLIAGEFTNDNLLIYGQGGLENEICRQIKEKGLEGRIKLMGISNQIPQVLSEAKIFVLSSDFEGMPNTLLEALAVGIPSVSTDCPCGGPSAVIVDGENGILVPVGDADAMADALKQLLGNASRCEQMGMNAKKSAEAFRFENVFKLWTEYIEKVVLQK